MGGYEVIETSPMFNVQGLTLPGFGVSRPPDPLDLRPETRNRFVLGLAGPSGSGKSAAAALLAARGAKVLSGDVLGRLALEDPGLRERVRMEFGFNPSERERLAKLVFNDEKALARLSQITWPWIGNRARMVLERVPRGLIVFDAAVLLEAGWRGGVDRVIVLRSPQSLRFERLRRTGLGEAQAEARIRAQAAIGTLPGADEVWANMGSLSELDEDLDRYLLRSHAGAEARRPEGRWSLA